jgi:hypothetical protein
MEKFRLEMVNKIDHLSVPSEKEYSVIHEFYEESLSETLQRIEEFLRGCGYYFEGNLDIVPVNTEDQCKLGCHCKKETGLPKDKKEFTKDFDVFVNELFKGPR